jgi:broad specificity phosphatase PhoE
MQARKLAEYWLRYEVRFDEVYSGPLVRQQRTAEIVAACYKEADAEFPVIQTMNEFKEYDADGILTKLAPALAAKNPEFRKLVTLFEEKRGEPDRNRYFQKMFESLMTIWLQGHIHLPDVESWLSFSSRVERGLKRIIQGGSRRRVAVFTSGGPIGVAVQIAVDAAESSVLELNWRVRNCSITELIFNRDRLTLDWFNSIPHLDETHLRTYR